MSQIGTWLQTGSSVIAELADASGFDWLLIDLEHGCGTEDTVLPQLKPSVVQPQSWVGAPHPDRISRALDWGAAGIMVPMVSTVEKAEACVRAMHFPPRGDRGLARMVRAFNYGLEKTRHPRCSSPRSKRSKAWRTPAPSPPSKGLMCFSSDPWT
ncbi:MAG: hypothetical protein H7A54_12895 [Akkermansiaceae bacterium]|nr:hypothetical protein [Akkermansiaceae bacterium]